MKRLVLALTLLLALPAAAADPEPAATPTPAPKQVKPPKGVKHEYSRVSDWTKIETVTTGAGKGTEAYLYVGFSGPPSSRETVTLTFYQSHSHVAWEPDARAYFLFAGERWDHSTRSSASWISKDHWFESARVDVPIAVLRKMLAAPKIEVEIGVYAAQIDGKTMTLFRNYLAYLDAVCPPATN